MDYQFIETHCHLDSLRGLPFERILELCKEASIEKMVTIAVSPENLDKVIELAQLHTQIYCTQGVHPHDADQYNAEIHEKIKSNATSKKKVVALGEMGLDYHYNHSPREQQIKVFEQQLDLACELNLPVVIHTREADEDTLQILKNFSGRLSRKGVLHSFTSGSLLAEKAIEEGFYLGFNGIITFKNANDIRKILQMVPTKQILFETDSPYLTPVPHRGKENAPYFLPLVAEKACEVRTESKEEFFKQVYQNSLNFFRI